MDARVLLGILLSAGLAAGGCLAVAAGAAVGAGVVYAAGEDSSEVYLDRSRDEVFDACVAELEAQGSVEVRDRQDSRIEGTVDGASVVVRLERPSRSLIRVNVRARKHVAGITPAPRIAERVASGVVSRLEAAAP